MGSATSTQLTKEEILELQRNTHFDEVELKHLWKHFARISSSRTVDGVIDKEEFQEAFGLSQEQPMIDRLFDAFDENKDGFDVISYFYNIDFISIIIFLFFDVDILITKNSLEGFRCLAQKLILKKKLHVCCPFHSH